MMNYPRFFIRLYFYRITLGFKAVALPYNPTYIKKIKTIKGYRWNPGQKYLIFLHFDEILSKKHPPKYRCKIMKYKNLGKTDTIYFNKNNYVDIGLLKSSLSNINKRGMIRMER